MAVRAIRGAITVADNSREEIFSAATELITAIVTKNGLSSDDIISIHFTATKDIDAAYPAVALRAMGLVDTPLFCAQEMHVQGSLPLCIRVLIHVDTPLVKNEIVHAYLRGAAVLRPDLAEK